MVDSINSRGGSTTESSSASSRKSLQLDCIERSLDGEAENQTSSELDYLPYQEMSLRDFVGCLREGLFTDDDGIAEMCIPALDNSSIEEPRLLFSPSEFSNLRVRWFNK